MQINEDLMERLKIFIYDLKVYPEYLNERLNCHSNNPQYYLSLFYFTEDEIDYLLNFKDLNNKSLKDHLDDLLSKSTYICTSHDLFPIFVFELNKGFEINYKKKSKKFKGLIH